MVSWKGRRLGAAEESRRADDFDESKHCFLTQKREEIEHRRDVDVIDHEQATRFETRLRVQILEIRKRIAVGAVQQRELEIISESILKERTLGRPDDELDARLVQKWRHADS